MKIKNLLSVCMITRNEAKNITRSIKSIAEYTDEIIVIDTGSQDETIKIAKGLGAKVYSLTWQDDFSYARNFSLKKANSRWILVLDADEELGKVDRLKFRGLLKDSLDEGYFLTINNLKDSGDILKTKALRLFRNRSYYHYENRIHEQIAPSIIKNTSPDYIKNLNLEIYHYGYLKNAVNKANKIKRNLNLLLRQKDLKNDSFYYFNLGNEYFRGQNYNEAEKYLKIAWKNRDITLIFTHRLILKLAKCLYLEEKYEDCLFYLKEGLIHYPDYLDLSFYYGLCFLKLKDLARARNIFLNILNKDYSKDEYIREPGCTSFRCFYALGLIEEKFFNYDLAGEFYLKAYRLNSRNKDYIDSLVRILKKVDLYRILNKLNYEEKTEKNLESLIILLEAFLKYKDSNLTEEMIKYILSVYGEEVISLLILVLDKNKYYAKVNFLVQKYSDQELTPEAKLIVIKLKEGTLSD